MSSSQVLAWVLRRRAGLARDVLPHAGAKRIVLICCLATWTLLADYALAAAEPPRAQQTIGLKVLQTEVGRYKLIEFGLDVRAGHSRPFDPDDIEVSLQVTDPVSKVVTVPAFFMQPCERRVVGQGGQSRDWMYPTGLPVWKARFSPSTPGQYSVRGMVKTSGGKAFSDTAAFQCVASAEKGFIRVAKKDPRFFEFDDGTPFFAVGQNLAFIGNQQYVSLTRAGEIFGKLAENGANYLRVWTCCEDWAMAIEARKSAWGRSWNWKPPFANDPDSSGKCIKLPGGNEVLRAEPSHAVALRPDREYILSGEYKVEQGQGIKVSISPGRTEKVLDGTAGGWTRFECPFKTGAGDWWLGNVSFQKTGGNAFLRHLALKEAGGGPELLWEAEIDRPVRGFYNPVDCFMLDELVRMAGERGIYLQLCLLTRDVYMDSLKDPQSREYAEAVKSARKFMRYAVARWGYSTTVAAWEYWNEMNPNLPTDLFYAELGRFLKEIDPYQHLRTTSTWGPSAKDCKHSDLDVADVHFYLRPTDKGRLEDEVHAVAERTAWLFENAPAKPAHLGEFGLADDKWGITPLMRKSEELADVHNALWASALSGASGTAMFWWWERLDQKDAYKQYHPVTRFVADVPWNSGAVQPLKLTSGNSQVRATGLRAQGRAWLWVFNKDASWNRLAGEGIKPSDIRDCELVLEQMPAGNYALEWWDTAHGMVLRTEQVAHTSGALRVAVPAFERDIACKVVPR